MTIVHFSYASDGGASRAGRRANLACRLAGLPSSFAFIEGDSVADDDIHVTLPARTALRAASDLSDILHYRIQWELLPDRRTSASNSLLSIPYPGAALSKLPIFEQADIIHLHWPTWGATPRAISDWLARGKVVFWTLHDMWAMTGGCHYSAGCSQFETLCMKCPQLTEDFGFIGNSFEEKLNAYGKVGNLVLLSPSRWLANAAQRSTILGSRRIEVVRNPIELDVFEPCLDRSGLRAALGIGPNDFVLMMGSGDLKEKRKGVELLAKAINDAVSDGSLVDALPRESKFTVVLIGKNSALAMPPGVHVLNFGEISRDEALRDVLSIADVLAVPSLEDNYPNMIVEAMACGTPVIGFDVGGVGEMIDDGHTGLVVRPAGSIAMLKQAIVRFAGSYFRSSEMRDACRAYVEVFADPAAIGRHLRELYEDALGRPVRDINPDVQKRVLSLYSRAPAERDANVGPHMLRFPSNMAVIARTENSRITRETVVVPLPTSARPAASKSLLTVRTYHEHHSAHSGPYQFVRYLSRDRFSANHMCVPLGSDMVSKSNDAFRKAGALIGANGFASQGNAWLAEAEVLFECAHREVEIVHFIDGDIAGMLTPFVHDSLFKNNRRPIFVATYHQPGEVLRGLINPNALSRYDGVIALCQLQAEFLATHVPEDKIAVIPHGIDVDFFHPPQAAIRSCRKSGPIRLLLVGHWLRDMKVALAAFTLLKSTEFEFQLRVVSPRFAGAVSDESIVVLKGLSDEELLEEYYGADLLYIPLVDATANNAILEAMACGLPVVSTIVGGVPETVGGDAGVLCEPGDAEDFARGVLSLLRSPDRYAGCSAAGRRRAELLSWERIGAMHEAFYDRLLIGGAGSGPINHLPI